VSSPAGRRRLLVEADGGSRGNPGIAGYGALVRDASSGDVLVELAEPLGVQSNNVAEYSGLIAGLRAAAGLADGPRVVARMDSKLVVEQMSGRWKVKHPDMQRLAREAREVCSVIEGAGGSVTFEWVPRDKNKAADALSNDAMDGRTVHRVRAAAGEDADAAGAPGAPGREPLRLLLVQAPTDEEAAPRIVRAVQRLVGGPAQVVSAGGSLADRVADHVAEHVASALGVDEVEDDAWAATGPGEGPDEAVLAAYRALSDTGGTVVVVTSRRGVLSVLSDVLGTPADRFWSLATAPGSLTAVEVWEDGSASVAFTNRTEHLA
jgi:ribonuclease HI